MTDKTNNSLTPVATQPGRLPVNQPGPSPVRVKLRRVNANLARPYQNQTASLAGSRLYLLRLDEWFFKADARLVPRQNDGALHDR